MSGSDEKLQRRLEELALALQASEARFRNVVIGSADGIIIVDESGVIRFVNPAAASLFDRTEEKLLGEMFGFPIVAGETTELDIVRDGAGAVVEVRVSATEWEGSPARLLTLRDITERRRNEIELRKMHRAVLDSPNMVVITDLHGAIEFVNPRFTEVTGYTLQEVEGREPGFLRSDQVAPEVYEEMLAAIRARNVWRGELVSTKKNGEHYWESVSIAPVRDAEGNVVNFMAISQEITERKRLEDELIKSSMQNELILASAGEGIIGLDLYGNQTFVNAAAAAMLGYDVTELVGQPSHPLWHYSRPDGSLYPADKCPIYAAYKDGTVHSGEEMFLRKDGTGVPVQFNSRPIFANGEIVGAVLTFNDITERKQAEEALLKSEERYRALFTTLIVGFCTIELIFDSDNQPIDYRFLEVNSAFETQTGLQNVQGRLMRELVPENEPYWFEVYGNIALTGEPVRFINEAKALNRWYDVYAYRVGRPEDRQVAIVFNDITDRIRDEERINMLNSELEARAAELESTNKELEAFSYSVAHDLRSPLNVISSYCQVIQELCSARLDQPCREYIEETYKGTMRMSQLIDALLNFSRLSHSEPHPETVDLSAIAREIECELKLTNPQRRSVFRIAAGIRVNGDPNLLRVVLSNLFGNAWKYTGLREEAVIEFGLVEIDGKPVCFVRDNGAGFENGDAEKLFIPFQRLHGPEQFKGLGIGLATVERIIRRHGGRIWADGEPDKGAVFYFTLSP